MQSGTKHRILGAFVVIALVIIMLPFFQGGVELPEPTIVKAPPFPDQSVQVSDADLVDDTTIASSQETVKDNEHGVEPDDIISVVRPSIVSAKTDQTVASNEKAVEIVKSVTEGGMLKPSKVPNVVAATDSNKQKTLALAATSATTHLSNAMPVTKKKPTKSPDLKKQFASSIAANIIDDDGLAQIKNAAWVIQIGSFQNKANALRLVNQLRANGYKAFIQQVSTTFGSSTRVFVGPEIKRNSAYTLATRLENDMHIHGIVISYKPLTL